MSYGTASSTVLGGEEPEEEDQTEAAFALEYQLRDFIAQNLGAIPVEGKTLRLYVDSAGRDWRLTTRALLWCSS